MTAESGAVGWRNGEPVAGAWVADWVARIVHARDVGAADKIAALKACAADADTMEAARALLRMAASDEDTARSIGAILVWGEAYLT